MLSHPTSCVHQSPILSIETSKIARATHQTLQGCPPSLNRRQLWVTVSHSKHHCFLFTAAVLGLQWPESNTMPIPPMAQGYLRNLQD